MENNAIVSHNKYFVSWLMVVKNLKIDTCKEKKLFYIRGIKFDLYEDYKKEYKLHKKLLNDLKKNFKSLS